MKPQTQLRDLLASYDEMLAFVKWHRIEVYDEIVNKETILDSHETLLTMCKEICAGLEVDSYDRWEAEHMIVRAKKARRRIVPRSSVKRAFTKV